MQRITITAMAATMVMVVPAQAATQKPFTAEAFQAAQAQNLPILVEVDAWWCPVCASQGKTIKKITAAGKYSKLVIFKIDYDKQKEEWRKFGVQKQGTLIAFRGKRETGRVQFKTDAGVIETAINSTLN